MVNLERMIHRIGKDVTQIKRHQGNQGQHAQNERPRAFNFKRSDRQWNIATNNSRVPNLILNNGNNINQVHNVDILIVSIPNWCRIHFITMHNETNCPKFKTALNIFHQEIPNMEIVSVDVPPNHQPNQVMFTEMADIETEFDAEACNIDDEIYTTQQLFTEEEAPPTMSTNEEVYVAQLKWTRHLCSFRRKEKSPMTTSTPPNNLITPPYSTSQVNTPPPIRSTPPIKNVYIHQTKASSSIAPTMFAQSMPSQGKNQGKKTNEEEDSHTSPYDLIAQLKKMNLGASVYDVIQIDKQYEPIQKELSKFIVRLK